MRVYNRNLSKSVDSAETVLIATMLHLILLTMLAAAFAELDSFQPIVRYFTPEEAQLPKSRWDEDSYLSYIKNMAMFPKVSPLSRQEFDKTSINRIGNVFDPAKLGILPPIDMKSGISREDFQSLVSSYMNLPGTSTDFLSLVRDHQKAQSNVVTYPSTSYGTPVPGSYTPDVANAQLEVMKLMRELLAKISAQPTPTIAQPAQYEYKLNAPSFSSPATPSSIQNPTIQAHSAQIRDEDSTQNFNKQTLHTIKQFQQQKPFSNSNELNDNYQHSFGSPKQNFYENQHNFNRYNYAPGFETSQNFEYPSLTYDFANDFKKLPRKVRPQRPYHVFENGDFSTSYNPHNGFYRGPKFYDFDGPSKSTHRKPRHQRQPKKKPPPKKAIPQKIILKISKT